MKKNFSYNKDICTSLGFLRFLWCILNMKTGGVIVAGILCSTWSIVNSPLPLYYAISFVYNIYIYIFVFLNCIHD